MTSGGHQWRPVQTCSLEDPPTTSTDIWWPPKHVQLASGRYSSHWNAFLFGLASCSLNTTDRSRVVEYDIHTKLICSCITVPVDYSLSNPLVLTVYNILHIKLKFVLVQEVHFIPRQLRLCTIIQPRSERVIWLRGQNDSWCVAEAVVRVESNYCIFRLVKHKWNIVEYKYQSWPVKFFLVKCAKKEMVRIKASPVFHISLLSKISKSDLSSWPECKANVAELDKEDASTVRIIPVCYGSHHPDL